VADACCTYGRRGLRVLPRLAQRACLREFGIGLGVNALADEAGLQVAIDQLLKAGDLGGTGAGEGRCRSQHQHQTSDCHIFDPARCLEENCAMQLHLDDALRIAKGSKRWVFVHPDDPSLLVKVMRPDVSAHLPVLIRAARRRYLDFVIAAREFREHRRVNAPDGEPAWFLQKILGVADTNHGRGLVVRAERGRDGNYAKTLRQVAQSGQFGPQASADLAAFLAALQASPVVAGDLQTHNVVYSYSPERGDHFVLIDGIGDKTWVPLQRLSAAFNRMKKARYAARLTAKAEKVAQKA